MLKTSEIIEFNNKSAEAAKTFWDKFQGVQTHLDRLSRYMSKREFITLACNLKLGNNEALYDKVLAVGQRIESMENNLGKPEYSVLNGLQGSAMAKLRLYFGTSVFYVSHFDLHGDAVGYACIDGHEFESGTIPRDVLVNDAFKIDFNFEPTTVSKAIGMEGCEL